MSIEYIDITDPHDENEEEVFTGPEAYIVMVGDMSNGHRAVGPFDEMEDALAWANKRVPPGDRFWIMNVFDPNSADAVHG
jgi:hypothetical protein